AALAWPIRANTILPRRSTAMRIFLTVSLKESGERTLMTPLSYCRVPPMASSQTARNACDGGARAQPPLVPA
ncbi:MAG: hypothetical protein WCC41_15060, partial [Rhodomicrobium sp.]